jgi:hypothetical protein
MVSREIWINMHSSVFERPQIALVLRTRAILRSLKNSLVHVIPNLIALETMLLPILPNSVITNYCLECVLKLKIP